jgi:hypothetical protein
MSPHISNLAQLFVLVMMVMLDFDLIRLEETNLPTSRAGNKLHE